MNGQLSKRSTHSRRLQQVVHMFAMPGGGITATLPKAHRDFINQVKVDMQRKWRDNHEKFARCMVIKLDIAVTPARSGCMGCDEPNLRQTLK